MKLSVIKLLVAVIILRVDKLWEIRAYELEYIQRQLTSLIIGIIFLISKFTYLEENILNWCRNDLIKNYPIY